MPTYIMTSALGILISIIGVINMTGNISTIHRYHRHRVTEENRRPFGKLVGIGTLIIGISLVVFGVLYFIFEKTQAFWLINLATTELLVCFAVGLAISFFAMIKYNKRIF